MNFNIPDTGQKRVVIVGGGFGGLTLARKIDDNGFQVVLIDKNNFHQFQPLFYQVAMAGLEPSSIVFPFRKLFQKNHNVFVRIASVQAVDTAANEVRTDIGNLRYDFLVLAIGADTNWYGNQRVRDHAIPMKSVNEALFLRNTIFEDLEKAVTADSFQERQPFMDIVVVGGGPTGVEVAGSLAEMKKHIIPKDYSNQLDREEIEIFLIHGESRLLATMSEEASRKAEQYLRDLGVQLRLNALVTDFDGDTVTVNDGTTIRTDKVIWAAGIVGNTVEGLPQSAVIRGNRIKVNAFNQVEGLDNVFAIGDVAFQTEEAWPKGHPQVAQVAIQQGKRVAENLLSLKKNKPWKPFRYRDLGSMATVGRHRAVVDLPFWKFQGAFAWFVWLFVHLFSLLGTRNKVVVFLNWLWNYVTYDQSLRLVIKPFQREKKETTTTS